MKNENAMIVVFKDLGDLRDDLMAAFKAKKKSIQSKNVVHFDSPNSFRNFMTLQKLELLTLIASADPKSIYDLAKMADRALAAVQKDCQMLERTGFISFKKQKGGRGSIVPKLKFNYDRIVVKLPDHPYALQFEAAA